MSADSKAVFLSYASQDAEAARRICDVLRAAGVEVWFDQSELVGGDAWDRKIRKQIKDCALFVPIISANTQARLEGYFRLEWKLAEDRSHLMAKGKPFIMPVCIDETKDWDTHVPDAFMVVQWTRLPVLQTESVSSVFCERVKGLLTPGVEPNSGHASRSAAVTSESVRRYRPGRRWFLPVMVTVFVMVAVGIWRPWHSSVPDRPPAGAHAPSPTPGDASPLTAKGRKALDERDTTSPAPRNADPKSVVVLPFANLSGDKEQEYFSDGLTEEILNTLARERDLRVVPRASAFSFKEKKLSLPEIARALNVAQVIEGSVRKSGNQVRIAATLTRVSDGFTEPLGTFTEELRDIFALQEKVAQVVVEKLTRRTTAAGVAMLTKVPAAYDAYLRGRAVQMQSQRQWRQAESFYKNATELDPGFTLAWARLAEVRFVEYRSGIDRSPAALAATQSALDHALQLQPDLPAALVVRANIARVAREDLASAAADLERAARLQPALAELRFTQAYVARDRGDWPTAFRLAREGLELSPRDGDMANVMAFTFWNRGDYLTADRMLVQAVAAAENGTTAARGNRVSLRNRWRGADAALRLWEATVKVRSDGQFAGIQLLLALGRIDEATRQFDLIEKTSPDWSQTVRNGGFSRILIMLEKLSRGSLARQLAEKWRAEAATRVERGNRGHYALPDLVGCEIALGNTASATRELKLWKNDTARLTSVYRRFDDFQDHAAPLYAWLGDADEAITIVSDYLAKGFQPGYLLRDSLAFASLQNDPRWQQLMERAEAWAKAQPDPSDP